MEYKNFAYDVEVPLKKDLKKEKKKQFEFLSDNC